MKQIFVVLLVVLTTAQARATAQSSDWMIYDGQFFHIADDPLDSFQWPDGKHPWFEIAPGVMSTGNYRGYLAIWEIKDGKLYLAGMDSFVKKPLDEMRLPEPDEHGVSTWTLADGSDRVDLKKLFTGRYRDGRVFADWFTGVIRIPDGKLLKYVHFGHASVSERDIMLYFECGVLTRSEIKRNKLPDDDPEKEDTKPNQPPQRNAGSRPSSDDSPASETPSSLGPRG